MTTIISVSFLKPVAASRYFSDLPHPTVPDWDVLLTNGDYTTHPHSRYADVDETDHGAHWEFEITTLENGISSIAIFNASNTGNAWYRLHGNYIELRVNGVTVETLEPFTDSSEYVAVTSSYGSFSRSPSVDVR